MAYPRHRMTYPKNKKFPEIRHFLVRRATDSPDCAAGSSAYEGRTLGGKRREN